MKKAKVRRSARTATRTIDRPPPRQKAALRSDAFAKAIAKLATMLNALSLEDGTFARAL